MTAAASSASTTETRLLTVAELDSWARMARPGDRFVYCSGPSSVPPGPTKARVIALRDKGVVEPRSGRAGAAWEHWVVKLAEAAPAWKPPAPPTDEAAEKIFEALERCVDRRRRAFSDTELARIAGLPTRNAAAWRVRKLEKAGRIESETQMGPDGPWRIVRIGRRRSKRPPAFAEASAGKPANGGTEGL